MKTARLFVAGAVCILSCGKGPGDNDQPFQERIAAAVTDTQIYGDALPPYTLAFTYDDGPDDHSIELATYLRDQGIRATFFTNGCRLTGNPTPISQSGNCDPMGHIASSTLGTLRSLGHRVANHSEDHADLTRADLDSGTIVSQLTSTQPIVDPYVSDGYYLFRAPYGLWSSQDAADVRTAPSLDKLTGPIHWDITGDGQGTNGGDWICIHYYHDDPTGPKLPLDQATATCGQFVLDALNARPNHNGIILFHDREEFAPGTNYPLLLTQWVVSHLDRSVYTMVPLDAVPDLPGTLSDPPVTLWTSHFSNPEGWDAAKSFYGSIRFGDLNRDGYDDICGRKADGIYCALSDGVSQFTNWTRWSTDFADPSWSPDQYGTTIQLGDINHDGRADICGRGIDGIDCALSNGSAFGAVTNWTPNGDFSDADGWAADVGYYGTIRLGDVNKDTNADVCGRGAGGIFCALSNGSNGFAAKTGWKTDDFGNAQGWQPAMYSTTIQLADVNGDGYTDVCGRGAANNGIACALSNGAGFGGMVWSNFMFSDTDHWSATDARYGSIRFSGKGVSVHSVCGRNVTGIVCADASSSGVFGNYRYVINSNYRDDFGWYLEKYAITVGVVDINGDHKLDVCGRGYAGIWCAIGK